MRKILVVDDEPDIVDLIKNRLKAQQFDVVTASNGEEALSMLQKEKPDLLVLDILMPKMDGYVLVKEIKVLRGFKELPIILLTAKDKMQDLFKMEGIHEYMIKPFDGPALVEKIHSLLKN